VIRAAGDVFGNFMLA